MEHSQVLQIGLHCSSRLVYSAPSARDVRDRENSATPDITLMASDGTD